MSAPDSADPVSTEHRPLAEAIPEQAWTATPDGALDYVNRRVTEYLGCTAEEVRAAGWFEMMHPEDREEAEARWQEALEMGEPFEEEFRLERGSDGAYRWFLCRAVPEADGDGTRWFGTNTDITEQKKEAIERERLATIIKNASDFIGSFNLDGEAIFLNAAGREMAGLDSLEDVRAMHLEDFLPEEDHAFFEDRVLPAVREEGRWRGELRVVRPDDGAPTSVDADLFLTRDPASRKAKYIVAVYRDVTPYKEAQEQAEQANKAKSEFLANMSHELRTPLNAVIGYSEMIREDVEEREDGAAESDEQDQLIADLEQIHTAGEQLLSMVNDVLDISKIEAGEMELHASRFDVREMVEETEAIIRPLVEDNDNEFELDCPEDIGTMHTDRTKLRQGLFNLLGNAAKFTEDGRVTLRVRREEIEGEDGGSMDGYTFAVEDTGIGMSEEDKAEVFEAFQQADTSLTRDHEGTGLGLVITRNFCRLMGGDVSVEGEEGKGSTFAMHLLAELEGVPESDEEQKPEAEASFEEKTGETPSGEIFDSKTPAAEAMPEYDGSVPAAEADFEDEENTVLVIDDDQRTRELIGRHLRKEGFAVATARGGEEGVEAARRLQPTAITLDVMMPERDGWDVLTELQNDEALQDIPVVMVTIVDDENMGYMLGASEYLTKPLNAERLVSVLRKYRVGDGGSCSVLLVEDDAPTRDLMRRTLEKGEGCTIYEAENGRVALDELDEADPDMILLDLMMPEMDGFTFLEKMHERDEYRSIPVVVTTAKELTAEDRERLNDQVETVLQKGDYDREELLEAVSNRVERVTS